MNLTSLETLFVDQLSDIYDAESQIASALPQMANAASHRELKEAFEEHLSETQNHIDRLHQVFDLLGSKPDGIRCEAAEGLIKEGNDVIRSEGQSSVKDAALIGAAQRVEHYEMAAYGTACALAKQLGLDKAAGILHETLEEEVAADHKLTKIATGGVFSSGVNKDAFKGREAAV